MRLGRPPRDSRRPSSRADGITVVRIAVWIAPGSNVKVPPICDRTGAAPELEAASAARVAASIWPVSGRPRDASNARKARAVRAPNRPSTSPGLKPISPRRRWAKRMASAPCSFVASKPPSGRGAVPRPVPPPPPAMAPCRQGEYSITIWFPDWRRFPFGSNCQCQSAV